MKLKQYNALKSTLNELASKTDKILMYGEDAINKLSFCYPISILKNRLRLLSCSTLDIHPIGFYPIAEKEIVCWLKKHIRQPTNGEGWWNLVDNGKWLTYNISSKLYIMKLQIAQISYYILLRESYMLHFRKVAFHKK